jgi:hypothetical protein
MRRLEEAPERMGKTPREGCEPRTETDYSIQQSGQKKNINGYDCREVVMTIITREKGKTLQESGGMVMTSNLWLGPKIAAMKEVQDFDLRYAQKMAGIIGLGGAEQMAAALAMYPGMKEAMGKFQAENVNMDGTAILTVMTMESVASAQQAAQAEKQQAERQQAQAEQDRNITSVRGLGGLIGRRMAKRKAESEPAAPAPSQTPGRVTIMTSTHELVRVSTALAPTDLSIPAGFKEKR